MDLELIFSEESEPFAGQLLVIDAGTLSLKSSQRTIWRIERIDSS
jgi:hypothetical protein